MPFQPPKAARFLRPPMCMTLRVYVVQVWLTHAALLSFKPTRPVSGVSQRSWRRRGSTPRRGVCLVALGKVRRRRQGSNSAPNHAISAPRLTGPCALFALTGAATLLETATNGSGSMPYLPGLAAAIRGTAAGLAAVPQSVPPTVRSSARLALPACCSGASVAMRRLCCQRRRRRAAQASRPCCPRLTCVFPACLPCAQPPPRRLRGASRGADMARCGPLAALTAANGRPTRMPTAADCAAVTTSMGGVCVVRRGAVAADVAAVSGMRARLDVCSIWVSAR